jgi:hypothetical protein
MTVTTINPKPGDVVLVAKGHRLRLPDAGISNIRRMLQFRENPERPSHKKEHTKQRGPSDRVAAAWKNLH